MKVETDEEKQMLMDEKKPVSISVAVLLKKMAKKTLLP
jgi:hypothetical protein